MSELKYELQRQLNKVKTKIKTFIETVGNQVEMIREDVVGIGKTVESELASIPGEILSVMTTTDDEIEQTLVALDEFDPMAASGPAEQFEKMIKNFDSMVDGVAEQIGLVNEDIQKIEPFIMGELSSIPGEIAGIRSSLEMSIGQLFDEIERMAGA